MFSLKITLAAGLSIFAMGAAAHAEDFWSYRNWNVVVQEVPSEEDDHVNCKAFTGGDGDPVVSVSFFSGDAGPPYSYPLVEINETSPRHYDTLMQEGDTVNVIFDEGSSYQMASTREINEEGLAEATASGSSDANLLILQAMQRNTEMYISTQKGSLMTANLLGFSAAYRKIAEVCGFSTENVLPD